MNCEAVLPPHCLSFLKRITPNRKGGACEINQPKVGPKGSPSGCERVHAESTEENGQLNGNLTLLFADYKMLQNLVFYSVLRR